MIFKNLSFCILLLSLFLIKISIINTEEEEYDKIKNVILSILAINSNNTLPSFSLKFKKLIMNFIHFSFLDITSFNFTQDNNDKSKYILNNITTLFNSNITISKFETTKTEFLVHVFFDKIIFNYNSSYLSLLEIVPKYFYFSENNQISKFSYFSDFNNMRNTTLIEENGDKVENMGVGDIFIEKSTKCLSDKISTVQNSFNVLTYDLDKILNNIFDKNTSCTKYGSGITQVKDFVIKGIKMPLKYLHIEQDKLMIDKMNIDGYLNYKMSESTQLKLTKFELIHNKTNSYYFKRNNFQFNFSENTIIFESPLSSKNSILNILNSCLNNMIQQEINNYYD